jgi:hypothetical protein
MAHPNTQGRRNGRHAAHRTGREAEAAVTAHQQTSDETRSSVMTKKFASVSGRALRASLATAACALMLAGSAAAQTPAAGAPPPPPDPNPGAITFTGNVDVLVKTPYIFRGIVQEAHPKLTLWPSGDIGIALYSGKEALKSATVNFGVWNSLQTGSSGLDNPATKKLHYEEDFYTALGLGFTKASFTTTYTAYTSPNGGFGTVHEISFKVAGTQKVTPYVLLAQELGKVGADGGAKKGTYLEVGVGPSWPVSKGKATVAIPVKVGLSAHNYYELDGVDHKFGFLDVGVLVTVPLTGIPASYGGWNFHIGGDALAFGDTTKAFNAGKKSKGVFLFGFGVSY